MKQNTTFNYIFKRNHLYQMIFITEQKEDNIFSLSNNLLGLYLPKKMTALLTSKSTNKEYELDVDFTSIYPFLILKLNLLLVPDGEYDFMLFADDKLIHIELMQIGKRSTEKIIKQTSYKSTITFDSFE